MSSVASVLDKCPYAVGESLKRKNIDEKRQLVHELSKDLDSAFVVLMKWGREELLQVLFAELGEKENKSKLKKDQIINKLLKVASEKKDSRTTTERNSKIQRKNTSSVKTKGKGTLYCTNLACQNELTQEDIFCKRCSCCICGHYDDNKDPSLWLACYADPARCTGCGFSCHLDCALKSEKSGIKEDELSHDADGCFYCVSCGKTNSMLECWEKQLTIARETTSVDVLCSRLVLAQKLLKGTEKYKKVSETVEDAVKCLESELRGPLTDLPSIKRRGNVIRLASAPEVKDLCSSALTLLEMQGSTKIRFEDVDATSLTLILGSEDGTNSQGNIIHYRVWHRKGSEKDYTEKPTCALVSPNTRFVVSELTPATEYCFKVVSFRGLKETGFEETKVSTKTSQEEETTSSAKEKELAFKETVPEKAVGVSNGASSSNQGFEFEDCVGVLRQLELAGYLETEFRMKFLTWYGLRANADERNFVKALVNNMLMIGDALALAKQLIHTFSDLI